MHEKLKRQKIMQCVYHETSFIYTIIARYLASLLIRFFAKESKDNEIKSIKPTWTWSVVALLWRTHAGAKNVFDHLDLVE